MEKSELLPRHRGKGPTNGKRIEKRGVKNKINRKKKPAARPETECFELRKMEGGGGDLSWWGGDTQGVLETRQPTKDQDSSTLVGGDVRNDSCRSTSIWMAEWEK